MTAKSYLARLNGRQVVLVAEYTDDEGTACEAYDLDFDEIHVTAADSLEAIQGYEPIDFDHSDWTTLRNAAHNLIGQWDANN